MVSVISDKPHEWTEFLAAFGTVLEKTHPKAMGVVVLTDEGYTMTEFYNAHMTDKMLMGQLISGEAFVQMIKAEEPDDDCGDQEEGD